MATTQISEVEYKIALLNQATQIVRSQVAAIQYLLTKSAPTPEELVRANSLLAECYEPLRTIESTTMTTTEMCKELEQQITTIKDLIDAMQ